MKLDLISGKWLALLKIGWNYDIISNDDGQFQFDSARGAEDHKDWLIESCKKYAIEHNFPISKVDSLRFEIKQIA